MFRAGGGAQNRVLDYYNSEKDSQKKNHNPKGQILLRDIHSITDDSLSAQFFLHSIDGVTHSFEANLARERDNWVFELNAVLFGKGPDGSKLYDFV